MQRSESRRIYRAYLLAVLAAPSEPVSGLFSISLGQLRRCSRVADRHRELASSRLLTSFCLCQASTAGRAWTWRSTIRACAPGPIRHSVAERRRSSSPQAIVAGNAFDFANNLELERQSQHRSGQPHVPFESVVIAVVGIGHPPATIQFHAIVPFVADKTGDIIQMIG